MKSPYPKISTTDPFYYVNALNVDLSSIMSTGDTKIQVYRVYRYDEDPDYPVDSTSLNSPPDYVSPYNIPPYYSGNGSQSTPIDPVDYLPIEQKKSRFTFVLDSNIFAKEGGRYRVDFYYKGTYISHAYVDYDKKDYAIVGKTNV